MASHAPSTNPRPHRERRFLLLAALIIAGGMALRLAALTDMPLYLDEATYIWWGQLISTEPGHFFAGYEHERPLFPLVLALFRPTGLESPFLGRMLSVFAGVICLAGSIGLGRRLAGHRAGLLAGVLYAALPLAVFHERQALVDPLMSAFALLALVVSVDLARRPHWYGGLLLGGLLGAATLAKISAITFFPLPFIAAVLLAPNRQARLRALAYSALAAILGLAILQGFGLAATAAGIEPGTSQPSLSRLRLLHLADPQTWADLARDAGNFADFTWRYIGPALILIPLSLPGLWQRKDRPAMLFVWAAAVLHSLAWLLVSTNAYTLPARYFLWAAAPLTVLFGMALVGLPRWLPARARQTARYAGAAVTLMTLGYGLFFVVRLVDDVSRAPLARGDHHLYVTGLSAGAAYQQAARDLLAFHESSDAERLDVMGYQNYYWHLTAYLGPRTGRSDWLNPRNPYQYEDIARWLASDGELFFVESPHTGAIAETHGALTEPFATYEHHDTVLHLSRVVGAEGRLAEAIYAERMPSAEALAADYDALAAALAGAPGRVLIFPASHAEALTSRGVAGVEGLAPSIWPLDESAAARVVEAILPDDDGAVVQIVQANPERLNPEGTLNAALFDTTYRVQEQWFGVLYRQMLVTGQAQPRLEPFGAVWEDAIHLERAALLDAVAAPGGVVRVALEWYTDVPVEDSFYTFAHLVDANGNLVAQTDGIPGGGHRPMPTWQPGQPIIDRFAILLPPDAPPGKHTLRLGIYHPDSGLRLRVTGTPAGAGDYVELGAVEIAP